MKNATSDWPVDRETLERMAQVDIRTVDINDLKDIRDVKIDTSLPKEERMKSFIRQIGNPYCYRHGDYVVKVSYCNDSGLTLEDCLMTYIRTRLH